MDSFKDSSKGSLSSQRPGGSSTSLPSEDQSFKGHGEKCKHFVSIPLAIYSDLQDKVNGFRASVEKMGFDKSLFVSPSLLHVTVVMLHLKDAKNLEEVSTSVKRALGNRPVSIRLKGLACMDESLDKTKVLYVPVEEVGDEGRLRDACHVMIDAFVPDKLAAEDVKSSLKLHVTMMNAVYRRDKSKGEPFDAREIHKAFREKDWGVYEIKKADISRRGWYDAVGYYHSDGSLAFPTSEK